MPNCPVCGNREDKHREVYISSFNGQEYKLYECSNCGLHWWEPLKIIPEFYEGEGCLTYEMFHLGAREEVPHYCIPFFKYFPKTSGKLLDVGCGDGLFLKFARDLGFEVWGIDFDSKSIKICQEKWGLKNTYCASPEEFTEFCQREGLKFDVITFFEVLEHQDKPIAFIEAIKNMLKEDGFIAGSVPNRESWITKKGRKIDMKVDFPPHHFLRFSKTSLKNLLSRVGFKDIFLVDNTHIKELTPSFQVLLFGNKVNKFFLKSLLVSKNSSSNLPKKPSPFKKAIYKSLRLARLIAFLPITIPAKFLVEGPHLYFHARLGRRQ
ncbi:MAG: class I SAM-dependent methyltransferase [Aquificaceae bacterium]